jgi:hypothetical protein
VLTVLRSRREWRSIRTRLGEGLGYSGVGSLKDEFDKVAVHNEHHLAQIRNALA